MHSQTSNKVFNKVNYPSNDAISRLFKGTPAEVCLNGRSTKSVSFVDHIMISSRPHSLVSFSISTNFLLIIIFTLCSLSIALDSAIQQQKEHCPCDSLKPPITSRISPYSWVQLQPPSVRAIKNIFQAEMSWNRCWNRLSPPPANCCNSSGSTGEFNLPTLIALLNHINYVWTISGTVLTSLDCLFKASFSAPNPDWVFNSQSISRIPQVRQIYSHLRQFGTKIMSRKFGESFLDAERQGEMKAKMQFNCMQSKKLSIPWYSSGEGPFIWSLEESSILHPTFPNSILNTSLVSSLFAEPKLRSELSVYFLDQGLSVFERNPAIENYCKQGGRGINLLAHYLIS